jgi:hypothetical protein
VTNVLTSAIEIPLVIEGDRLRVEWRGGGPPGSPVTGVAYIEKAGAVVWSDLLREGDVIQVEYGCRADGERYEKVHRLIRQQP